MISIRRLTLGRGLSLSASLGSVLGHDLNAAWLPRLLGFQVGRGAVLYARCLAPDSELGEHVLIETEVRIGARVAIAASATIRRRAVLGPDVDIGSGCTVGEGARLQNISIEHGTAVESEVVCLGHGSGRITVGRETYLGLRSVLDWSSDIKIGDFVHIAGPSTALWTHSSVDQALHGDLLAVKTRRTTAPIEIGNRVYIGGNCTVYPGVTIGNGAVILPNSAVNRDVPEGVLAGGVPVRVLRSIASEGWQPGA